MTKEELLKTLEGTLTKSKVEKLAALANTEELLELTFYHRPQIAFRASWVLEHVAECSFKTFEPFVNKFLIVYPRQKNESCRRHFTKVLMLLQKDKAIPMDTHVEALIEVTFEWLINPNTPVAVRVNCLDILYNFIDRHEWIREELAAETEFLMKNGSPAIIARGKAVLRKLQIR